MWHLKNSYVVVFKVALTVLQNSGWSIKKRPRTNPVTSSPLARDRPLARRSSDGDHAMRVEDELFGSTLVEVLVALRGLLQSNDRSVDRLSDLHLVVQDRIHQLAMVPHDRALTGSK